MFDIVVGRSKRDTEKYGCEGTIYLGKQYVKMGQVTSLSNKVFMDLLRAHVVFICGKRGGGKCLTGDALITLSDGSIIPISELEHDDRDILSLDDDLKIKPAIKSEFYKRQVDKILKLTMKSGKEINLTPEHPLLTIDGWVAASTLQQKDRIATPRCEPAFGEHDMEEHKVKILAYLIAEGHMGNGFILFTNTDDEIIQDFRHAVNAFDKMNTLGKFLAAEKIYGHKAGSKFIPQSICRLPKQKLSLFLNRLFSCDGTIYKSKSRDRHQWIVGYSSKSKLLIRQVQSLLLRYGIHSKIRLKKTDNHELLIRQPGVSIFLQEIGFFGLKLERQKKALLETPKHNPNDDTIPKEIWDHFRPECWADAGRDFGYKHPKALRESMRYSPSRQKLMQLALFEGNEAIAKLASSDIFWDEVVCIEEIHGRTDVYDLSVPGSHNFIANDIIVHNSYTMGVMAEGMASLPEEIRQNLSIILLDTMGIYWTMKYANQKEDSILSEWDLEAKPLDVKIYTPKSYYAKFLEQGIPTDAPFSIKPSELSASDWCMTFGIELMSPMGILIERTVNQLNDAGLNFSVDDMIATVRKDIRAEKDIQDGVENLFMNALEWGLFDYQGTSLRELAAPGQITVLDVSCYSLLPNGWNIKSLVIGLVSQKLFIQRMEARKKEEFLDVNKSVHYFSQDENAKQEMPLVWLVVDEAHEFLPREGKTIATDPLVTILREGRQPGLSLVLATQQPGKIHTDVMTQSDIVISHRITTKIDIDALSMLMQSYMRGSIDAILDDLPRTKGAAIVFDDTNERMYPLQIRPRFTWHGGESPTAYHKKEKKFSFD